MLAYFWLGPPPLFHLLPRLTFLLVPAHGLRHILPIRFAPVIPHETPRLEQAVLRKSRFCGIVFGRASASACFCIHSILSVPAFLVSIGPLRGTG